MRVTTVLNKLLGMQGVWVRKFEFEEEKKRIVLDVAARGKKRRCGRCGKGARRYRDRRARYWRHLDLFGMQTYLRSTVCRVECRRCGVITEEVEWAKPGSRFTRAFEQEVAWLAQRADLSAVAAQFRITWRSVRRIIETVVEERMGEDRWKDLWLIGVDELGYRRHHSYLTIVVNHMSGKVVWVGKDRKAETLEKFFAELGPERAGQIDAVTMDMWEPYVTVIRQRAPQAERVYDRFHIVRHLNKAVDAIRWDLVRRLRGAARRDLRNTKFPLLRSRENRTREDWAILEDQVRANRPLYRGMLLKDDFMDLYTYRRETEAREFLRGWLRRAMRSGLEPMQRVARMLRARFEGVVAWVKWQMSNGRLEGTCNRVRLLSHRSYGLHSAEALAGLVYLCCSGIVLNRTH